MTEIKTNEAVLRKHIDNDGTFALILKAMQESNEQAVRVALEMARVHMSISIWKDNPHVINSIHSQVMKKLKSNG